MNGVKNYTPTKFEPPIYKLNEYLTYNIFFFFERVGCKNNTE